MLKLSKTLFAGAAISAFALGMGLETANATEGYFANGIGARHKALAGAGAADSRDATATTNNPAGLVHADDQLAISASLFSPLRGFTATNPLAAPNNVGFTPQGHFESKSEYFVIPNIAFSKRVQGIPLFDVIGLSISGNGGMNTDFQNISRNTAVGNCVIPPPSPFAGGPIGQQQGVFCGGKLGVNLEQMLIAVTVAKQFDGFSVGVSPVIVRQTIDIHGLAAFGAASQQFSPTAPESNLTNQGSSEAWGFGARLGVEAELMPNVRLGITGTTPMLMSEFSKYSGLFAENGDFDIPPSLQVGLAVDVTPNLTIMADYKRIWYGYTKAISNPSTNIFSCNPPTATTLPNGPGCLGNKNGAGFGWDDINVYKVGVELRDAAPGLTLRAGYAYSENPIQARDVMFNLIAPGIVKHHISGGAMLKISDNMDLELAGLYVPEEKIRGNELAGFGNPFQTIELEMSQWEVTAGIVYHFGGPEEALK